MTKTFIDTFYIVAPVNKRDEFHQKAKELVLEFDDQPLLTTDAILLEIGNSLARSYKQKSVQIISEFLFSEEIEIVSSTKFFSTKPLSFTKFTPINLGV